MFVLCIVLSISPLCTFDADAGEDDVFIIRQKFIERDRSNQMRDAYICDWVSFYELLWVIELERIG